MTRKEFLKAVADNKIDVEVMEYAAAENAKLEEAVAKKNEKANEKSNELYSPFISKFMDTMTDELQCAKDLLSIFDGMETPAGKKPSVQFVCAVASVKEKESPKRMALFFIYEKDFAPASK